MTFEDQKAEARKLSDAELARHALVSKRNRHSCRMCFTCACVEVEKERRKGALTKPVN